MISATPCGTCGHPLPEGTEECRRCHPQADRPLGGPDTSGSDALRALLTEATLGEYDVAVELGRGGMATVYLAHEMALDRDVAIKVMAPALFFGDGMAERFRREARTAASLSHPHIIPIYTVRQTDRLLYFVMKFVEGRSMDSVIHELGPLPIPMVLTLLHQVGGALAYAHRRRVIHRDIKPANIMIDNDGWAVVTDFGIAKALEDEGLTSSGAAVGTPCYMSPEQCSSVEVTGASDQYSLGIVAYEMLTGKPPFAGTSLMQLMRAHFFEEPPDLAVARPDCPEALRTAVRRMVAKEPNERWPSIEAALAAMGSATSARDDSVRSQMMTLARSGARIRMPQAPTSPVPPSGRNAARFTGSAAPTGGAGASQRLRRRLITAAAAAAAIALGVLALAFRPERRPASLHPAPPGAAVNAAPHADSAPAQASRPAADTTHPSRPAVATRYATPGREGVDERATRALQLADSVRWARRLAGSAPGATVRDTSAYAPAAAPPPSPVASTAAAESTAAAPPSDSVTVILGSKTPGAVLYVNGVPRLPVIAALRGWKVPRGTIRLSIRAEGCRAWDTTLFVSGLTRNREPLPHVRLAPLTSHLQPATLPGTTPCAWHSSSPC